MSLFDKYKPYLYDTLSESERKKVGVNLFTQLTTLTSNAENGNVPNVYLGTFTKAEIGFIGELVSDFVKDSDYGTGVSYNKKILEDLVVTMATDNLLDSILSYCNNNKGNLINKLGVKVVSSNFNPILYITNENELNTYSSFFDGIQINTDNSDIVTLKVELISGGDKVKNFDNISYFYRVLREGLKNNIKEVISLIISRLQKIYSGLYRSPAAILTMTGHEVNYLSINDSNILDNTRKDIQKEIGVIAKSWRDFRNLSGSSFADIFSNINDYSDPQTEQDLLYTVFEEMNEYENLYLPYFHLRNLRFSSDEFMKYTSEKGVFFTSLYNYLNSLDGSQYAIAVEKLLATFTNFLCLSSVNGHTFLVRGSFFITEPIASGRITQFGHKEWENPNSIINQTFNKYSQRELSGTRNNTMTIATLLNDRDKNVRDVVTVTFIYDKKTYEHENLFAYKLYKGPNKYQPNISAPILGVKLDGSLCRENIFSKKFINIVAGSRSGKGTLTMSLLAPLLLNDASIIYLDNKPDIASLFWNLEKNVNSIWGEDLLRFLAIDANNQLARDEKGKVGRVCQSNRHINDVNLLSVPEYFDENDYNWLKLLRNIKLIELLCFICKTNLIPESEKPKSNIYIFIDEATDYFGRLNSYLYQRLSDNNCSEAEFEYFTRLAGVIETCNDIMGGLVGTMKTVYWNKFKIINIGQSFCLDKWQGETVYDASSKYEKVLKNLTVGSTPFGISWKNTDNCYWLSGKEQALLDGYAINPNSTEGGLLDGQNGVPGSFILHDKKPKIIKDASPYIKDYGLFQSGAHKPEGKISNYTFIRTYFALVNNDITKEAVMEIQNNLNCMSPAELVNYLAEKADSGYTSLFLSNVAKGSQYDGTIYDCLETALHDIYDFENDTPRQEVGFEGLLNLLLNNAGLDLYDTSNPVMKEKLKSWSYIYDYFFNVVKTCFGDRYSTLEAYLSDVSIDSLCNYVELEKLYNKGSKPTQLKRRAYNFYKEQEGSIEEKVKTGEITEDEAEVAKAQAQEEAEKKAQSLLEEQEAKERAEELAAKNALKAQFRAEFNKLKTQVGPKITDLYGKLKKEKDEVIFKSHWEDYTSEDYKEVNFISKFDSALKLVESDPEVHAECEQEVKDFVNGRYSVIMSMTFSDTDVAKSAAAKEEEKRRKEAEKNSGSDGFTPPIATPGSGTEDGPYQVPPERVNQPPVAREKPRPVNQYAGRRLDAPIDTGNLTFDLDEYENEGSRGPLKDSKNVKVAMQLVQLITKDIKRQFGGSGEIEEITITAGGGLVLNGFAYMPQFDDALIQSMPQTKQVYYQNGDLAKVVNIGAVVDNIMDNVFMLSIESPSVANSEVFQNEIGVKNYNYSKLFRRMSNLQTIILPDGELTRNGPQEVGQTGLGLGAKLAGIFGFGKGKKDSQGYVPNPSPTSNRDSMTDRIFESKPVKVMAGALGWTLGCKAVVMAATIFGPWGLLFGAFAAAGAYKEIKNGNNQRNSQSQRRDNRSGGQNRNNQGRNNQGRNQNKQNKQGNGGFSQNYSSQGRPPRNNNNDEDWY